MDFLNKASAQMGDLFKSMTPGARITAALLLVTIVVSLGYLFRQNASSADAYLMGGEPFQSSQLAAMEAAFSKADLAGYEIDGNRVRVPRGQQVKFMGALADAGALPPDFGKYMEKAVNSGSPFTSRSKEADLMKIARQQELQNILRSMKGIESASVLYDAEIKRGFGQENIVTASVNVKPVGTQPLDEERVPAIRHLVASAIAGLKPENITVTDLNGMVYPAGTSGGTGSSSDDPYISRKKLWDKDWTQKVQKTLAYIPGVIVSANVELDTEITHEENSLQFDKNAVDYRVRTKTNNKVMKKSDPAGRPGLAAQGGVNQPATLGSSGGTENTDDFEDSETAKAVPTTTIRKAQQGLTPKRVTVSVAVPNNYYETIWAQRNPPAEGQPPTKPDAAALEQLKNAEKLNIQEAVVAVLPKRDPTLDPFPWVTVTSFQQIAHAELPAPQLQDRALAWLGGNWQTLGMGGLALMSLVMLRSMVRTTAVTNSPAQEMASLPAVTTPEEIEEDDQPATARTRLKRRSVTGPSLRDELSDLVREDPDSAVNILRTWIGSAS